MGWWPKPAISVPVGGAVIVLACSSADPRPSPSPAPGLIDAVAPNGFPAGPLAAAAPADSPLTEARARLGERLFFDPRLSRTGEISCGSCHQQEHAFADPNAVSSGVEGRKGNRNAPALVNLAWGESFFWDGRVKTLEEQAGKPIENPVEMDLAISKAAERLNADPSYVQEFIDAFGEPPGENTLRAAIASFVRTLVSGDSRYDRYLNGEEGALNASERRGEELFLGGKTGCFHCHPPAALTNEGFFNNGSYVDGGDIGRRQVTGLTGDLGRFKVPGLRNVARSAPYMHDGSLATLEDVVEQYDRGGRGHPSTDPQIAPLGLSAGDKQDLLAFLRSLTDERFLDDPRYRP